MIARIASIMKKWRGGGGFSTLQQLQTAVNHLAELNRPYYNLQISGGECTCHPHFFDFIKYASDVLKEKLGNVVIMSNGSASIENFEKLADLAEQTNLNVNIQISIHSEYSSLKHMTNIVKKVSKKINLCFALMFNPGKREFVAEAYETMGLLRREYPFSMSVVLLYEPPKFINYDSRYTEEDMSWQIKANELFEQVEKESPFKSKYDPSGMGQPFIFGEHEGKYVSISDYDLDKFMQFGLLDFRGMYCMCGSNTLNVYPNGICQGIICSFFNQHYPDFARKYNIFRENPYKDKNFTVAIKCPYEKCICAQNHWSPKFRDPAEAANFVEIVRRKQARLLQDYPG